MGDSLKTWNDKGYALTDKGLERTETLVSKKVKKLPMMQETPDNKVGGNKKVRNAEKIVVDGVKFDSRLEYYMYTLLKGAGIDFEFQKVYLLQEWFRYNTATIRAITLTVDFYLPFQNQIIDTKGFSTEVSKIKFKMLKKYLNDCFENGYSLAPTIIEMPRTKKECQELLNKILYT